MQLGFPVNGKKRDLAAPGLLEYPFLFPGVLYGL